MKLVRESAETSRARTSSILSPLAKLPKMFYKVWGLIKTYSSSPWITPLLLVFVHWPYKHPLHTAPSPAVDSHSTWIILKELANLKRAKLCIHAQFGCAVDYQRWDYIVAVTLYVPDMILLLFKAVPWCSTVVTGRVNDYTRTPSTVTTILPSCGFRACHSQCPNKETAFGCRQSKFHWWRSRHYPTGSEMLEAVRPCYAGNSHTFPGREERNSWYLVTIT